MFAEIKTIATSTPRVLGALIALAGVGLPELGLTQTTVPYFRNQYTATYVPITNGTVIPFISNDDDTVTIPIGFTFTMYGVDYTQVHVGTNGAAALATSCMSALDCGGFFPFCTASGVCEEFIGTGAFGNPALPSTSAPNALIAPFWDDLFISTGAVTYQVLGAAPNRELVIQWAAVGHYTSGFASQSNVTMQVRLSEASGAIRLHYGPFNQVAAENALWSGTIGIENADGTIGEVGLPCGTTSVCGVTELISLNNQVIEWVGPAGVELVPTGVAPTGGNPGASMQVQVTARNVGTLSATTAFDAAVYFSTDTTLDMSDTLLGTVTFNPPIASRSAVTSTLTTTVPNVAAGFYSLFVVLDSNNTVAEDIETNNTVLLTDRFLVGSDLAAEIDTPPDSGSGETVDLVVRILNLGASQGAVPLRILYSRDQIIDPMDTVVATTTVAVPAAPSTSYTIPAVLPVMVPGAYYAIVEVDPNNVIIEADENNNIGVSPNLSTLEGPDLVAENIDSPGDFGFRGLPMEVFGTIANEGLATATGFYYGIYLSENQLCSAVSDPQLGEFGPINLGPQATLNFTQQVDIPANINPVPHHLCLIVNSRSTVLEGNQNNNIDRTIRTIDIRDPQPDFTITEIRAPGRAAAGESVTLQRTLLNAGNAPGMTDYEVYLSADTTLDPTQDILLGAPATILAPGEEDIGVDTLLIPATVMGGAYYVIYRIDPADAIPELFEDNNVLVSGDTLPVLSSDLVILTPSLPIATVGVMYDVFLAASGGAGSLGWSVESGILPAGLSLDGATGRLSGVPTEEGAVNLVLSVTDGALRASKTFTLLVTSQSTTLEILTRALPPGFVARRYQYPLTAFGGVPPYNWEITGGSSLPDNFVLSSDGIIAGTPDSTSINQLNIRVTDALGSFAERPVVLRIVDATDSVRMADDVLPDGRLGEMYDETLRVAPGTGSSPFTFGLAGGELPPGLSMDMDRIFGVPERVGLFAFSVRVADSRGDFDINQFIVEVDESQGITFITNALPRAVVGEDYVDEQGGVIKVKAISAASTGTVSFAVVGGALPPGITLAEDGNLSGNPDSSGTFSFTVLASDDLGQMDARALGIIVEEPEVVVPPPGGDDGGCGCSSAPVDGDAPVWPLTAFVGLLLLVRRRRRGWPALFAALLVGAPAVASAQTTVPYFVDTRTETYTELSGGTTVTFQFGTDDSDAQIALPFGFRYYGVDHTTVNVGTNGLVVFGGSATSLGNSAMPSASTPNNTIALWWDDLVTDLATTHVMGTAPSRVFIIQYETVRRFSGAAGNPKFQLWLYEGPGGRFEVRYGPVAGMSSPTAWNASAGWENSTGTEGGNLLSCTSPGCDGTTLQAAENLVVRVQADAGPDVQATGIDVPAIVYAGVPFTTPATMSSLHQNALGPFVYTVHVMSATDTVPNNPVYQSAPVTLQPYQALVDNAMPTVPLSLPAGRYRLALVVDSLNQLAEPDESNNVFVSTDTFRLAPQQPDFVVADVTSSVQSVAPGGSFQANVFLRNRGNLDGSADWRLVLSRNQVVSPEDLQLATDTINLPLLTTTTVTVDVTLPGTIASGQYYLGAVIDPDNAVREIDEVNNTGISATPISVSSNAVTVGTTSLPGAYVGIDYTHFLAATGGDGAYLWSIDSGSLPAGLSLVPNNGELRGQPTQVEQATLTVRVESAGQSATQSLTIDVAEPNGGVTIVTRALLPGQVGAAYPPAEAGTPPEMQQRIVALGGQGEVTFELDGNAPNGLELDADGYLHGVPAQAGVFDINVIARDSVGEARRTIPLTIANPGRLTLVAATLPQGRLSQDYNYDLRVVGRSNTATVSFSANGPLPPGIVVANDGRIVGIPQQVGVWVFNVIASEGTGVGAAQDSANFRLQVVQDDGFAVVETTLPTATLAEPYEVNLTTRMGQGPMTWRVLGPPLPRGLSFEVAEIMGEQQLRFRGTPEEVDTVSILVTVTDGANRFAQQPLTLEVREKEVVVVPPPMDGGCVCATPGQNPAGASLLALAMFGLVLVGRRRRP